MDDAVWVPTVFSKNRERLLEHDAVIALFNEVVEIANERGWLSREHFSVDGTLIQAWAGHKSFKREDADDEDGSDFRGQSQQPHARVYERSGCVCIAKAARPASCATSDTRRATTGMD
ncbi:hypothetical protein GGD56_007180 [Rhizobium mongolense]|uniref:DDE family transposase n=1 Tax=Rhizobium mongolense TaxID=57676 RepID=A0ABR6IZC7_9HYPH|nr:hypothetical protein [Rhizobium mongolense]